jgi:hypothetical protein
MPMLCAVQNWGLLFWRDLVRGMAMRKRFSRILALMAFFAFPSSAQLGQMPIADQNIVLRAEPVDLFSDDPERKDLGGLRFESGWALTADSAEFGGWSGMVVNGTDFTLVGDSGAVLRFALEGDKPVRARLSEVPKGCGFHWSKPKQDSESIAHDPATGQFWVGLENQNAICRLNAAMKTERMVKRPEMKKWAKASGAETLTRLKDGRFLVMAEGDPRRGASTMPVLLFDRDPTEPGAKVESAALRTPAGFLPVDATQLPDGRVLLLLRDFKLFSGFSGRLVVLDLADLRAGAILSGTEIARFASPALADNFEAIAINRDAGGIAVWIASDDNFTVLQRSLLLKFRLAD